MEYLTLCQAHTKRFMPIFLLNSGHDLLGGSGRVRYCPESYSQVRGSTKSDPVASGSSALALALEGWRHSHTSWLRP